MQNEPALIAALESALANSADWTYTPGTNGCSCERITHTVAGVNVDVVCNYLIVTFAGKTYVCTDHGVYARASSVLSQLRETSIDTITGEILAQFNKL